MIESAASDIIGERGAVNIDRLQPGQALAELPRNAWLWPLRLVYSSVTDGMFWASCLSGVSSSDKKSVMPTPLAISANGC